MPADWVKLPVPVYGAVPPVAVMVTVVLPPLHNTLLWLSPAAGLLFETTAVAALVREQPLTSVIVTVYDPDAVAEIDCVVAPPGLHK